MSDNAPIDPPRPPTVYFIDDSATMREVIKIAFRKENIQVVTCPDAASALAQFAETPPDAVITDVIMPDKDGYEVCQAVKSQEQFARTPVILMSGVVNRSVAEKAMAVKADELIRKPFHPQDLIGRVRGLLVARFPALTVAPAAAPAPAVAPAHVPAPASSSAQVLSSFFGAAPGAAPPHASEPRPIAPPARPAPAAPPAHAAPVAPLAPAAEVQKLRNEIRRLELLVKKLQVELDAARDYSASLEAHVKTLQD